MSQETRAGNQRGDTEKQHDGCRPCRDVVRTNHQMGVNLVGANRLNAEQEEDPDASAHHPRVRPEDDLLDKEVEHRRQCRKRCHHVISIIPPSP